MMEVETYGGFINNNAFLILGIIIGIISICLAFAIIKKIIEFRQYKKENDPIALQQTTQTPAGNAMQQVVVINNEPQNKKDSKKPKIGFAIPVLSVLLFLFIVFIIMAAVSI